MQRKVLKAVANTLCYVFAGDKRYGYDVALSTLGGAGVSQSALKPEHEGLLYQLFDRATVDLGWTEVHPGQRFLHGGRECRICAPEYLDCGAVNGPKGNDGRGAEAGCKQKWAARSRVLHCGDPLFEV